MYKGLDFLLYLLSDEKVQKNIKAAKDTPDLLGRLVPLLVKDFFRPDIKKLDKYVKESRNFRELGIRLLTDLQEESNCAESAAAGRVLEFSSDVSSESGKVSNGNS